MQNSLEDYNPFEQEQSKPQLQINSTNNAAVVQPLSQNIPPTQQRVATTATPSTSVQKTTEELQVIRSLYKYWNQILQSNDCKRVDKTSFI